MTRTIPLLLALTACSATGDPADVDLSLCPAYSGLHRVGAERAYRSTPAYEETYQATRAWVSTVVDAEEVQGGVRVVVESVNDEVLEDGFERHDTSTDTFRCDAEGLWLVHHRFEWDVGWLVNDYTAPVLELPAEVVLGQEWTSAWSYESATHDGAEEQMNGQRVYEATLEEQVHTPAGTFDTVRVELKAPGHVIPFNRDPEVGVVLTDGMFELEYFVQ